MTAAPVNIVAMRMSCPGQSTKETCLRQDSRAVTIRSVSRAVRIRWVKAHLSRCMVPPHPGRSQAGLGGVADPYDL
jgi:hypothetical protein